MGENTTTFTCFTCGGIFPVNKSGGTGYGTDRDDNKHCYACCAAKHRQEMIDTGRALLYYVENKPAGPYGSGYPARGRVTDWGGKLEFQASPYFSKGRHNIAGTRQDLDFNGPDGYIWHGVVYGENTQLCHCKRTTRSAFANHAGPFSLSLKVG